MKTINTKPRYFKVIDKESEYYGEIGEGIPVTHDLGTWFIQIGKESKAFFVNQLQEVRPELEFNGEVIGIGDSVSDGNIIPKIEKVSGFHYSKEYEKWCVVTSRDNIWSTGLIGSHTPLYPTKREEEFKEAGKLNVGTLIEEKELEALTEMVAKKMVTDHGCHACGTKYGIGTESRPLPTNDHE